MDFSKNFEKTVQTFIKEFLSSHSHLSDEKVVHEIDDTKIAQLQKMGIPQKGRPLNLVVREMTEDIYAYGHNSAHPRYMGFIPGPASPLSWFGDIMTNAYNRHAGSWANYPGEYCVEQELIQWLCQQAGFPNTAGGTFVSGGSMANLTAVTVARDKMLPEELWPQGVAYVSEQTHSSVAKGLRIIGISNHRIRKIPTDGQFRMDIDQLRKAIKEDRAKGLAPFLVIASAGTTNTGSIDPFAEIHAICKQHNLWMHVDGAFGASMLLSHEYKKELQGIELADSLSWDAHKWLFQTYGCGIILMKDRTNMVNSFHVHPEYLKDLEDENNFVNPWDTSIELTRPARGVKLWFTLQVMGSDAISDAISHGIQCAKWAEAEIQKNSLIEIVSPAQMAVINFRYNPSHLSEAQKNELNKKISQKIIDSGFAGVFTTELEGKKVLRMCTIHPDTTREDILNTIQLLNRYYEELIRNEEYNPKSPNNHCLDTKPEFHAAKAM